MTHAICSACSKPKVDPALHARLCGDCLGAAEDAVALEEAARHEWHRVFGGGGAVAMLAGGQFRATVDRWPTPLRYDAEKAIAVLLGYPDGYGTYDGLAEVEMDLERSGACLGSAK